MTAVFALHARHYRARENSGGVDGRGRRGGLGRVEEQRVLVRHAAEQIAEELVAVLIMA